MTSAGRNGTTPGSSLVVARIETLENALRDILDFTSGWSREMTMSEAIVLIQKTATEALDG